MRQEDLVLLLKMTRYTPAHQGQKLQIRSSWWNRGSWKGKPPHICPKVIPTDLPGNAQTLRQLLPQWGGVNLPAKTSKPLLKAGGTSHSLITYPRKWNWETMQLKHADNQSCFSSLINPSKSRSNGNEGLFSLEVWLQSLSFTAADIVLPWECGMLPCACEGSCSLGWLRAALEITEKNHTLIKISNRGLLF